MKAVSYRRARQMRGHTLVDQSSGTSTSGLLQQVITFDATFRGFEQDAGLLDQYYTATRYPDMLPGDVAPYQVYSDTQSAEAIEKSRSIVTHAAQSISGPT